MSPLLAVQPWPLAASLFPLLCLGPTRKPETPSAPFPAFLLGRVRTELGVHREEVGAVGRRGTQCHSCPLEGFSRSVEGEPAVTLVPSAPSANLEPTPPSPGCPTSLSGSSALRLRGQGLCPHPLTTSAAPAAKCQQHRPVSGTNIFLQSRGGGSRARPSFRV